MKWSYITAYVYAGGAATGVEYQAPAMCSDYLYNRVPTDGSTLSIFDSTVMGYSESIEEVESDIEFYLNFSPYQVGQYMCTGAMIQHPFFNNIIKILRFPFSQNDERQQYVNTNPPGIVFAYNYLDSGTIGTCGFYQPPACWVGGDSCTITTIGTVTHWIENVIIEPEAFIDTGKFNPAAMHPVAGYSETTRLDGVLHIDIWYDPVEGWGLILELSGSIREYGPIWNWLTTVETGNIYDYDDPNNNDPNRNNAGGNGDGDNNDGPPIIPPELPDADMTAAGSIRLYAPTVAQLTSFMQYLHSAAPVESIMKLWQNPIQGVVSLHYLPYPLRLKSNTAEEIGFMGLSTGINALPAEQWQTINFSYAYCPTNKNTYLDRAPYTKVSIYLPGIGIRYLNTDDCIGKYVFVKYNCDNVSGQCVAFVSVGSTNDAAKATVRYSYSGSLAAPFPITQNNWGQTYAAAATLAAGAIAAGVTAGAGGAAAGAAAEGAASTATGAAAEGAGAVNAANVATGVKNVGSSLASIAKPTISRSGTISGTTSLMSVRIPYLIIEKPNVQDYADFNKIKGYALGKTFTLKELKGYTEVEKVHIKNIPATAPELAEIESLLTQGVIL